MTRSRQDVYERSSGTTKLVSYGPNSFDGPYDAIFGGNSADGTKVWFRTTEPLVSADTDNNRYDVYERSSNSTRIVSTGGGLPENDMPFSRRISGWCAGLVRRKAGEFWLFNDSVFERFGGNTVNVSEAACLL